MAKTIYLICVGKLSNKGLQGLIDEYLKRINPFLSIKIIEIKELGFENNLEIEKESEKIFNHIEEQSFVIVCDEKGKNIDSDELFNNLDNAFINFKSVTFIIGGAFGLSEKVKNMANLILSLSKMTFTHQTARLIVVEQLYRYCMKKIGHPFVK